MVCTSISAARFCLRHLHHSSFCSTPFRPSLSLSSLSTLSTLPQYELRKSLKRSLVTSLSHLSRTPTRVPVSPPTTTPTLERETITYLPLPRSQPFRRALLLLSIPSPPTTWPSHLHTLSPLFSACSIDPKVRQHQISVNAVYDGYGSIPLGSLPPTRAEVYPARLVYPDGKVYVFPKFSLESLKSDFFQRAVEYQPDLSRVPVYGAQEVIEVIESENGNGHEEVIKKLKEILVCTHGARDCRCSERGIPLVYALKEEVRRRGVKDVIVREIAHVGGHKFAANAILLPSLDMMSNLSTSHAPALLDHLLSPNSSTYTFSTFDSSIRIWDHWRGRIGIPESNQADIWEILSNEKENGSEEAKVEDEGDVKVEKEMIKLTFQTFQGEIKVVDALLGQNLLQVGKENSLPSMEGVCGGNLECATCHVYLPGAPVPEPSEDELDMLGYAIGYRDNESRLGCQITVTRELGAWCLAGGLVGLPRF